jgi:hypothetical protein
MAYKRQSDTKSLLTWAAVAGFVLLMVGVWLATDMEQGDRLPQSQPASLHASGENVEQLCPMCAGTGKTACMQCRGVGKLNYARGVDTCDMCRGNKVSSCIFCKGKGKLSLPQPAMLPWGAVPQP